MSNLEVFGQRKPPASFFVACSLSETSPFFWLANNGPLPLPTRPVPTYEQSRLLPHLTCTKPSPVTCAVSCPSFKTTSSLGPFSSLTTQPLPQLEYVKLPSISRAPDSELPIGLPKNKTSHSTVNRLVKSNALPT